MAQQQRWDELLDRSGLAADRLAQVRESVAYGPLLAALREAESRGLDVERTFPRLVAVRGLDDAFCPAQPGEVLAQAAGSNRPSSTSLIAGLIPRATGVDDPDMARALDERDEAMQRRSHELAEQAIDQGDVWVIRLGMPPVDPAARQRWVEAISTVAAYRDRWNIGGDDRPLGSERPVAVTEAAGDLKRAQVALQLALRLGAEPRSHRAEAHQAVRVGTTTERSVEF